MVKDVTKEILRRNLIQKKIKLCGMKILRHPPLLLICGQNYNVDFVKQYCNILFRLYIKTIKLIFFDIF